MMSRKFIGIGTAGVPRALVARFDQSVTGQCYFMTLTELCDWIEHQMSSGFYYTAREVIAVDRAGLVALIEAQRKVLAGKVSLSVFPVVDDSEQSFADYVLTSSTSSSVDEVIR